MRIFAFTAILLVAYQAILWLAHVPPGLGRDNYEANCITSENYRYLPSIPDVLIVGSSKTNFFDYSILGNDNFHFGYGGQGALTGLEVLNQAKTLPKVILVEVGDTIQWPADEHCVKLATNNSLLADNLSLMQHRFQPAAILLLIYNKFFPREIPTPEYRRYLVELQRKQLSMSLPEKRRADIIKNADRAAFVMDSLRKRGARVVLFDAPVEREVDESQYVTEVRNLVRGRFDKTDFQYLPAPSGVWQTRDGTHFMPESARLYSVWLRKQLDLLLVDKSVRP